MNQIKEENLSIWTNQKDWDSFFNEFHSYLRALACSYKLPSQDVDDVVQEIFIAMAKYFQEQKFDSSKGNICSWVTTFAKWRIVDIIRRNQRQNKHVTSGDDLLMEMQPDENQDLDVKLENKYQKKLFIQALKNLGEEKRSKDYMIFCDMHFNYLNNDQLIQKYKINRDTIYLAKHRMIKRIKEEVGKILCEHPNY